MDIARKFPFARIKKCATIMGRKEEDDLGNKINISGCLTFISLYVVY